LARSTPLTTKAKKEHKGREGGIW